MRDIAAIVKLLVVLTVCFPLGLYLCMTIHEVGHLLAGLITGYSFVFIRVVHIGISRKGISVCKNATLSGQCIVIPSNEDQSPSLLILGGVILNGVAVITFILLMGMVPMDSGFQIIGFIYLMMIFWNVLSICSCMFHGDVENFVNLKKRNYLACDFNRRLIKDSKRICTETNIRITSEEGNSR